jgi:hypothetical protein
MFSYDVKDNNSFERIQKIKRNLDLEHPELKNLQLFLAALKKSPYDRKNVQQEEAIKYAKLNRMIFVEVSALTGEGVEELFSFVACTLLRPIDSFLVCSLRILTLTSKNNVGSSLKELQEHPALKSLDFASLLRWALLKRNIPIEWDGRKLSDIAELIKANAGSIVRTSDAAYSIPENSETVILLFCENLTTISLPHERPRLKQLVIIGCPKLTDPPRAVLK